MRVLRAILAGAMLVTATQTAAAAGDDEQGQLLGRILGLVQSVVHDAAQSNDPRAVEKGIDSLLSGEYVEANRIAGELLGSAFEDLPPQYKRTLLALAKDLAIIVRKGRASQRSTQALGADAALQARKDLAAMGLRYFDTGQFHEAVKRDDVLAVELFVVARGIDPAVHDADGVTALEHAQRRKNRQIVDLLETARRSPSR